MSETAIVALAMVFLLGIPVAGLVIQNGRLSRLVVALADHIRSRDAREVGFLRAVERMPRVPPPPPPAPEGAASPGNGEGALEEEMPPNPLAFVHQRPR